MRFPLLVRIILLCFALCCQAALSADDEPNATTPAITDAGTSTKPVDENKNDAVPDVIIFPLPDTDVAPEPEAIVVPEKPGRIALLLPLKSATFGRAAEAVKEGFLAE